LLKIIIEITLSTVQLCKRHFIKIILAATLIASFLMLDGPHTPYRATFIDVAIFASYWILLGVASSIGLGTGLHTFVLYLGPHIAQVTLAANQCNAVP
jgi:hypothetical protein